ncbi:DMT family transporter [Phenylobacterium sp.]|uniref:EamA family transporter n=1 Tax=Phenylobacterium sp. TaxID=1871053 RepID=UPI0035AE0387
MAGERPLSGMTQPTSLGATGAVLAGLVFQNLGAAYAKTLFATVGVLGTTALRVTLAALVLSALARPWRRSRDVRSWRALGAYGMVLGLMNISIYEAFARIPIGVAVAIELMGPLAVAVLGSRRWIDLVPVGFAVAGLALLTPIAGADRLDPYGVAFAVAAAVAWALYIVCGARLAEEGGGPATVALGLVIAAVVTAPLGLYAAGGALLDPRMLAAGLALALLSSVAPYTWEMVALRRLTPRVFGLFVCSAPAIAALLGWLVLGEGLAPAHGVAILIIMIGCLLGAWKAPAKEPVTTY